MQAFKKYIFLVICGCLCIASAFSQDTTTVADTANRKKVILIIPFNPKLYMSEVDKKIGMASNKDFNEVRNFFRKNMVKYLYSELSRGFIPKTTTMGSNTRTDAESVENSIYSMIDYQYEYPYASESKKNNQTQKEENQSGIVKGEINAVPRDIDGKYFSVIINDKKLIPYLVNLYNADLFLFISQFEMRNELTDEYSYASEEYDIIMKIHYTLYNKRGRILYGNYDEIRYPAKLKQIEKISENYLKNLTIEVEKKLLLFK